VDEKEKKKKKGGKNEKQQQRMTVSLGSSLASEGMFLFVDLWEA